MTGPKFCGACQILIGKGGVYMISEDVFWLVKVASGRRSRTKAPDGSQLVWPLAPIAEGLV